ncbi:MAG: methyltransferase domain-containing protein [Gammaproteobacteria bacterium]|nr:methyltransferase domain-containing protein [Gammaproteobacteria bacterium]
MDYEIARANMIEQQIRPWNVLAIQTLNALGEIRREDFVPKDYQELAFADIQIPLANGEVMLEPKLSARMLESLSLEKSHRVLEIGMGTGYLTALLATVSGHVTSVEIDPQLHQQAKLNLAMAGIENIELVLDDCHNFCHQGYQYDAVLISGSMPVIPPFFLDQIPEGALLVGIEGNDPAMQVVRYTKSSSLSLSKVSLLETSVRRLRNVDETPEFQF